MVTTKKLTSNSLLPLFCSLGTFSVLVLKSRRKQNSYATVGTNFSKDQKKGKSLAEQGVQRMCLEKQEFVAGSQTLSNSRLTRAMALVARSCRPDLLREFRYC